MILYSMVSSCSLEGLFLTGFVPGLTITAAMCVYCYWWAKRNPGFRAAPFPTFKELVAAYKEGFWSLMLPVVIFAGIFSGAFTANEAAVVACVYALIVEMFIHKTTKWSQLRKIMVNSAVTSASLLIIVAGATVFGKYLTIENIPTLLSEAIVGSITSPWVFLMIMQIWLLIVGMFMDCISATLILTPIFLPMLEKYDINVVHFGLLMTINLAIGYTTPPLGVSLYITGAMRNKDLIYVSKAAAPFVLIQIACLLLYTYWPSAVLWLPRAMGWNVD
jgi:C4-dicarboxylate transporter DctM subunit